MEMQILSHSAAETQALARRLGAQAFPGAVVALWGDMGAGKTAFVHGLCPGYGPKQPGVQPHLCPGA